MSHSWCVIAPQRNDSYLIIQRSCSNSRLLHGNPKRETLATKLPKRDKNAATPDGQVHEGIAVLVQCPGGGKDGGLPGAQMPCEEEQSSFAPPSLTAQHQSCSAVQGSPPWRDATSSCVVEATADTYSSWLETAPSWTDSNPNPPHLRPGRGTEDRPVQEPRLAACKQSHMVQGEGGCAPRLLTEGSTVLKQMQRWSNSWEN